MSSTDQKDQKEQPFITINDIKYHYENDGGIDTMPPYDCYKFTFTHWMPYVPINTFKRHIITNDLYEDIEQPTGGPNLNILFSVDGTELKECIVYYASDGVANKSYFFNKDRFKIKQGRYAIWFRYDSRHQCIRPIRLEIQQKKKITIQSN